MAESDPASPSPAPAAFESGDLHRIAYELALRALSQQEAVLNEVRARTGILLAASSLAASFLGAEAIARAGFNVLACLAVLAFVGSVGPSIYVLFPRKELRFSLNGPELFERFYELETDLAETHRQLAYWVQGFWDANQTTLDALFNWYRFAAVALVVEVVRWTLHLGGTLA